MSYKKNGEGPKKFSFDIKQLTYDGRNHPKLDERFSSARGIIDHIDPFGEDGFWKIAVKRNKRRLKRAFLISMENMSKEAILPLLSKKVFITPKTMIVQ